MSEVPPGRSHQASLWRIHGKKLHHTEIMHTSLLPHGDELSTKLRSFNGIGRESLGPSMMAGKRL